MKKGFAILTIVVGFVVLLAGLLIYGLGVHNLLPIPRPDLVVVGTSLIGIMMIISGACDLFLKKTKEMEIEEKDERNIVIANAAMAIGFKVMSVSIAVVLCILVFCGYMTEITCFSLIGAYLVGQIAFVTKLWYLQKTM